MKKLIGTVAVAALLASAAFAELSISNWVRQLWSPVKYNGGDVVTNSQNAWGTGRTAGVGFNWVGDDENAGASFSFVVNPWDNGGMALDGNNIIWVKPWDFLKLTLGHWDGINDISTVNTASWDWVRPNNWLGNLYAENEHTGAMIEIFPVDGLTVRVGLPFGDGDTLNGYLSYGMFEALHAEVEYTITDLLGIKLAWLGGGNRHTSLSPAFYWTDANGNVTTTNPRLPYKYDSSTFYNIGEIDVLLQLLAVENLQLDLGARINLLNSSKLNDAYDAGLFDGFNPNPDKDGKQVFGGSIPTALIGLKAGYAINDKFSVKADFAVQTYKTVKDSAGDKFEQKPDFAFGVGVGVGLTDSLSLDADFRVLLHGEAKDAGVKISSDYYNTDPTFSFLVGLNYACSTNAVVGIGFQGKTNGGAIGDKISDRGDNFGFAVPIKVEVSF